MVERVVDSDYYQIQHFISESPWDAMAGFDRVAVDTSQLFAAHEHVVLLIDESARRKKGKQSVGVGHQYYGTIGKVDNCQVAVYAALSVEKYYGLLIQRYTCLKTGHPMRRDAKKLAYLPCPQG